MLCSLQSGGFVKQPLNPYSDTQSSLLISKATPFFAYSGSSLETCSAHWYSHSPQTVGQETLSALLSNHFQNLTSSPWLQSCHFVWLSHSLSPALVMGHLWGSSRVRLTLPVQGPHLGGKALECFKRKDIWESGRDWKRGGYPWLWKIGYGVIYMQHMREGTGDSPSEWSHLPDGPLTSALASWVSSQYNSQVEPSALNLQWSPSQSRSLITMTDLDHYCLSSSLTSSSPLAHGPRSHKGLLLLAWAAGSSCWGLLTSCSLPRMFCPIMCMS